ncbi:uncharacterized protein LOC119576120 isoform X1 [Penaeus monodon]|uniref:uncharacterized protein LOC119576120 isoform X1 n=1 Tax=Penaeus monodon TaxID=6687 RepID=UPI0018A71A1E|nr:uncharacterized protein LOC119576120 isoform X1 [Penaeus monodon]
MISWCSRCLGLGSLGVTSPNSPVAQPLSSAHKNLRLRRSIVSRRGELTDDSEEEEEDVPGDLSVWQEQYVVKRQPGLHPTAHSPLPETVVVQVQPPSTEMHRPDLEDTGSISSCFLQSPDSTTSFDNASVYSSYGSTTVTDPSSTSISNLSNVSNSNRGSIGSLVSLKSSESVVPYCNTNDGDSNVNPSLRQTTNTSQPEAPFQHRPPSRLSPGTRRPHPMFLTPEEAAKPPSLQPLAKVHAFSPAQERLWLGKAS